MISAAPPPTSWRGETADRAQAGTDQTKHHCAAFRRGHQSAPSRAVKFPMVLARAERAPHPTRSAAFKRNLRNARARATIRFFRRGPAFRDLASETHAPRPSGSATFRRNLRGAWARATCRSFARDPAADEWVIEKCAPRRAGARHSSTALGQARHIARSRAAWRPTNRRATMCAAPMLGVFSGNVRATRRRERHFDTSLTMCAASQPSYQSDVVLSNMRNAWQPLCAG